MKPIHVLSIVATLTGFVGPASGIEFYFDTQSSAGWLATAGGAVDATPYVVANNFGGKSVSITSTSTDSGTFLSGGSLANFDGYWTAKYSFYLPPEAANVQMDYTHFSCDDRGVMKFNGNIIDSVGLPQGGSYDGFMVFTEGGGSQAYTFNGGPMTSGAVASGFIIGGMNTIEGIVNNTHYGVTGPLDTLAWDNGTGFGLYATVSYTLIPEPSSAAMVWLGLSCLAGFRGLRVRKN
jgi:hypothetical protein